MQNRSLTTREIAKHCVVTQRTVTQWILQGKLKSFRTPGKHIRVHAQDFLEFLKKYEMPIPEGLSGSSDTDGKKRILVVDDDRGMTDSIRRLLLRERVYDVETAFDGFEAGQKFASYRPHLIVLDLNMPGINGFELCARIRNEPAGKHVKILAISGVMQQGEIDKIMSLGADDYLPKPFEGKKLVMKIEDLLGQQQGRISR